MVQLKTYCQTLSSLEKELFAYGKNLLEIINTNAQKETKLMMLLCDKTNKYVESTRNLIKNDHMIAFSQILQSSLHDHRRLNSFEIDQLMTQKEMDYLKSFLKLDNHCAVDEKIIDKYLISCQDKTPVWNHFVEMQLDITYKPVGFFAKEKKGKLIWSTDDFISLWYYDKNDKIENEQQESEKEIKFDCSYHISDIETEIEDLEKTVQGQEKSQKTIIFKTKPTGFLKFLRGGKCTQIISDKNSIRILSLM